MLQHCNPLIKVSIVPRGTAALGYAQYLPKDQYLYTGPQLLDRMCMTLGGRIAESIVFGRISTGASDDLDKVTQMATAQVTSFGMSKRVGPIAFKKRQGEGYSFGRPYSEATQVMVDEEIRLLVSTAYTRTEKLLRENRDALEKVAQRLLEDEIISREVVAELIGPRPYETQEESAELDKAIEFYHHAEEASEPQKAAMDDSDKNEEAAKEGGAEEGEDEDADLDLPTIPGREGDESMKESREWWDKNVKPVIKRDESLKSAVKWINRSLKRGDDAEKSKDKDTDGSADKKKGPKNKKDKEKKKEDSASATSSSASKKDGEDDK
eukprot:TRINITY_DN6950_c0_g1_i2.p2 TRINITY_DN6950_c0_g1~~TRINITY_DN6950_c0_g1_i2.p2  ORF type:complete len:324 (+),score=154.72 TRINITY_DN6950_c0_g1_i2:1561-2532(+)